MPIGWVGRLQPGGRDHRRQALHQVAQRAVALAAGADDHPGAEVGQRRALAAQRARGLVAAAQVLGAGLVAQPAEVDDPLDPLGQRHPGEVARGRRARARRSRPRRRGPCRGQVVGDVDVAAGSAQAAGVVDVALVQVDTRPSRGRARGRGRGPGQRTSAPRAASERARRPPTKPVAPVTSARISGDLPRVAVLIAILRPVKRVVAVAALCCSLTFAVSACASSGDEGKGDGDRRSVPRGRPRAPAGPVARGPPRRAASGSSASGPSTSRPISPRRRGTGRAAW